MKKCSISFALLLSLCLLSTISAAEKAAVAPVRMGSGIMTFDTVPEWGLSDDGKSQIGPTHGGVTVGENGLIYTSADIGVFVFDADGELVNRFLGDDYTRIHDLEIYKEGDREFIYAARNASAEGIKFDAETGDVVLRLKYPEELDESPFAPTAITVGPDGTIFLADGYATNRIFKYDKEGKYQSHFGKPGNGLKQFNTCHGMTLDTRYDPPRLLVCDRNHTPEGYKLPRGRLLHYDLDGNFLSVIMTGLGMPTSASVQGDFVSVPDLYGRVVVLDKTNSIMAVLGYDPEPGVKYDVPQDQWKEGIFMGTHGSDWDADGNLYVQDWNVSGRIMKLVRVK